MLTSSFIKRENRLLCFEFSHGHRMYQKLSANDSTQAHLAALCPRFPQGHSCCSSFPRRRSPACTWYCEVLPVAITWALAPWALAPGSILRDVCVCPSLHLPRHSVSSETLFNTNCTAASHCFSVIQKEFCLFISSQANGSHVRSVCIFFNLVIEGRDYIFDLSTSAFSLWHIVWFRGIYYEPGAVKNSSSLNFHGLYRLGEKS